jgi:hypothetical protein
MFAMKTAATRALPVPTPLLRDATWTPESNRAVAELLDHLAEELAREYVRLMEAASRDELDTRCKPDWEEG